MTVDEFLDYEDGSDCLHEYFHGEMFTMEDTSYAHEQIIARLGTFARQALAPRGCEVLFGRAIVAVDPKGHYAHPDIVIVCGKPEFTEARQRALSNPRVIFEVLSPSTQDYDRGAKFRAYRNLPSLAEYVNVHQSQPAVEHHTRQSDGSWVTRDFAGMEAILRLEAIGLEIPFAQIYEGVDLTEQGTA